eukprot:3818293-Pyramimonas_sp.AAC.1
MSQLQVPRSSREALRRTEVLAHHFIGGACERNAHASNPAGFASAGPGLSVGHTSAAHSKPAAPVLVGAMIMDIQVRT